MMKILGAHKVTTKKNSTQLRCVIYSKVLNDLKIKEGDMLGFWRYKDDTVLIKKIDWDEVELADDEIIKGIKNIVEAGKE